MNRIIKFRGKRIDDGEWVYGSLVNNLWLHNIDGVSKFRIKNGTPVCEIITGNYKGDCWEDIASEENAIVEVIPESVGQFTGLTDKNKVEAFEGDIIERSSSTGRGKVRGIIVFEDGQFRVKWTDKYKGWNDILYLHLEDSEVIGSIHTTPELIK